MTLIDKEELMNDLNISWGCSGCKNDSGSFCKLEYDVTKVCKNIRSAKEREIIRCMDCKHWETTWTNDFAPNYHYCPLVDGTRRDDFYCADAELRGGSDG